MDGYWKKLVGKANLGVSSCVSRVNAAQAELRHAQNALARADEYVATVDAFICGLRPALSMPAQGEQFFHPDNTPPECMVDDPAFGFGIRFTASHKGLMRMVGSQDELEFDEGDLLEYLGCGASPQLAPGDQITITREWIHDDRTVLRRAVEPHDEDLNNACGLVLDPRVIACGSYPRVTQILNTRCQPNPQWPPVSGVVVSVEPRCSGYACVHKNQSLTELRARRRLRYFTLRQIFVPVELNAKAAAKKK